MDKEPCPLPWTEPQPVGFWRRENTSLRSFGSDCLGRAGKEAGGRGVDFCPIWKRVLDGRITAPQARSSPAGDLHSQGASVLPTRAGVRECRSSTVCLPVGLCLGRLSPQEPVSEHVRAWGPHSRSGVPQTLHQKESVRAPEKPVPGTARTDMAGGACATCSPAQDPLFLLPCCLCDKWPHTALC